MQLALSGSGTYAGPSALNKCGIYVESDFGSIIGTGEMG